MDTSFKKTLFGFNKDEVNTYVEKVLGEFNAKIKHLEEENSMLKKENGELTKKYEALNSEREKILKEKDLIAQAIINANEKAELIVEEARIRAVDERNTVHGLVEAEKEKLVDMKERIRFLQETVSQTLRAHEGQLKNIVDKDDEREE